MAKKKPQFNRPDPYQHLLKLDFQTKYRPLLKIHCTHEYFSQREIPDLEIFPAGITALTLKRLGLFFRKESDQTFSIGYGMDHNGNSKLKYEDDIVKLSFWIQIKSMHFINYTDLPYELGDIIYYFTNMDKDKVDPSSLTLSTDEFVGTNDRLAIMPNLFTYKFEQPLDSPEIQIVDELDDIIFEEELDGEFPACNIDLTDALPGKYRLLIDGFEEKIFYLHPPRLKKMFGVIDIYINKEDMSPYKLVDKIGKVYKKDYIIAFDSRSTRWKYVFMEGTPEPIHNDHEVFDVGTGKTRGRIREKVEPMDFSNPEVETLPDGSEATVIYTNDFVKSYEMQLQNYKLRTKKGKGEVEWITDLPCITKRTPLKPDKMTEDTFLSELVVYL